MVPGACSSVDLIFTLVDLIDLQPCIVACGLVAWCLAICGILACHPATICFAICCLQPLCLLPYLLLHNFSKLETCRFRSDRLLPCRLLFTAHCLVAFRSCRLLHGALSLVTLPFAARVIHVFDWRFAAWLLDSCGLPLFIMLHATCHLLMLPCHLLFAACHFAAMPPYVCHRASCSLAILLFDSIPWCCSLPCLLLPCCLVDC